jgi:hypothetical protein
LSSVDCLLRVVKHVLQVSSQAHPSENFREFNSIPLPLVVVSVDETGLRLRHPLRFLRGLLARSISSPLEYSSLKHPDEFKPLQRQVS